MNRMNDFSSNIPHRLATQRRNNEQCINCGKPEVHVELNSCASRECIQMMRSVARWSKEVCAHIGRAA